MSEWTERVFHDEGAAASTERDAALGNALADPWQPGASSVPLPNQTTTRVPFGASASTDTQGWSQLCQLFTDTVILCFTTDLRPAALSLSITEDTEGEPLIRSVIWFLTPIGIDYEDSHLWGPKSIIRALLYCTWQMFQWRKWRFSKSRTNPGLK